jgi:carboxylate-amine ligase
VTPAPSAVKAFSAYGVEIEYMIVSRETLDVLPIAPAVLARLSGKGEGMPPTDVTCGTLGWSNELVCHLLELKNPKPATSFDELSREMSQEVARMNALLEPLAAQLMPGGMHPWMAPSRETVLWPHDNAEIYATYDRIFDCRSHGWANVQSQHLNLPFSGDEEFARLHAAVRLALPILPAIAASSPFNEGRPAGYNDARIAAYSRHTDAVPSLTGALVPETSSSPKAYVDEVLEPIYRDIGPLDPEKILRFEWINSRGAIPRFDRSALEIRVLDVQECPAADLAIAALSADLVRYLYEERTASLDAQQRFPTQALRALLLECARDAELAHIEDRDYLSILGYHGESCSAATLWSHIAGRMEAAPMPLVEVWRNPVAQLLQEGSLARRLLKAAGPAPSHGRLVEVYGSLCACLAEGRMFRPAS